MFLKEWLAARRRKRDRERATAKALVAKRVAMLDQMLDQAYETKRRNLEAAQKERRQAEWTRCFVEATGGVDPAIFGMIWRSQER